MLQEQAGQRPHRSYPTECGPVCARCGSSWPTPECCPPAGWLEYRPDSPLTLGDRDTQVFYEKGTWHCHKALIVFCKPM